MQIPFFIFNVKRITMKKLIILNFIFLLLLNLLLLIKEYFFITYNLNSKFDDFTYL